MADTFVMSPWVYFLAMLAIAWHGLTYKDADGERPAVHLLFGLMALAFAVRFLFVDILGLPVWGIEPVHG